jgi:heptaprenyl diphosphate synthase
VLHALNLAGPEDTRLLELLTGADLTDSRLHSEALSLLRPHPAMEAARADLRRWADAARGEVAALPEVPAREAFETMCDYVVERTG